MNDTTSKEASDLFAQFKKEVMAKFKAFHIKNPHVYDAFIRLATEMQKVGHTRYSQYGIMHRIRWENDLKTTESDFKINDSFTPIYARLAECQYPHLKGFFETRKSK